MTGIVKFGKPGRLIVDGLEDQVEEYLTKIRNLHWQKMSIKTSEVRKVTVQTEIVKERSELKKFSIFDEFTVAEDDSVLQEILQKKKMDHLFEIFIV